MKKIPFWSAFVAMALILAGCAGQKEPATKAVGDVQASLSELRPDAERYAQAELGQVDAALASLNDSLAQKDYKAVLAAAPAVAGQVSELQQTIATKRSEMEAAVAAAKEQWTALSADVPKMLTAIQSRVDMLGKSRSLPRNVSKANFQSAQEGLAFIKETWAGAGEAFDTGNALDAVDKGQAAKDKADEVLALLGMKG